MKRIVVQITILLIFVVAAFLVSFAAFGDKNIFREKKCATGGCSGEMCGEESLMKGIYTTCVYRPEYACYQFSKCELQATGECGWTQTSELLGCLNKK